MASKLFPKNMHSVDRAVRALAGIGLLSLTVVGPQTPWGYLGIIPLLTGIFGFCPLYSLFKIKTN